IRDRNVTGVQTCALPISIGPELPNSVLGRPGPIQKPIDEQIAQLSSALFRSLCHKRRGDVLNRFVAALRARGMSGFMFGEMFGKIGRASCRERVESVVGG